MVQKYASLEMFRSRVSSVSIVSDYTGWTTGVRSPAGAEDFSSSSVSRPALGPTQPPVQWVPGIFSPGVNAAGAWCWPLTSIYCRGREWVGAIHPLPPSAFTACSGTALPLLEICTCLIYNAGNYCRFLFLIVYRIFLRIPLAVRINLISWFVTLQSTNGMPIFIKFSSVSQNVI
jgi:hypothetical protein